jgi:hypothetical protein
MIKLKIIIIIIIIDKLEQILLLLKKNHKFDLKGLKTIGTWVKRQVPKLIGFALGSNSLGSFVRIQNSWILDF